MDEKERSALFTMCSALIDAQLAAVHVQNRMRSAVAQLTMGNTPAASSYLMEALGDDLTHDKLQEAILALRQFEAPGEGHGDSA